MSETDKAVYDICYERTRKRLCDELRQWDAIQAFAAKMEPQRKRHQVAHRSGSPASDIESVENAAANLGGASTVAQTVPRKKSLLSRVFGLLS